MGSSGINRVHGCYLLLPLLLLLLLLHYHYYYYYNYYYNTTTSTTTRGSKCPSSIIYGLPCKSTVATTTTTPGTAIATATLQWHVWPRASGICGHVPPTWPTNPPANSSAPPAWPHPFCRHGTHCNPAY